MAIRVLLTNPRSNTAKSLWLEKDQELDTLSPTLRVLNYCVAWPGPQFCSIL